MNFLEKIKQLRPVSFKWRKEEFPQFGFDADRQVGLIAQEVEKVFPELVSGWKNGFKGIRYDWLQIYLLQAIIEQQKIIEKLERDIKELKKK